MVVYYKHGFNLSEGQKSKISAAYKNTVGISLRLSKKDLQGNDILALTQAQLNKIKNADKGVQIKLSLAQLKHMVKTGGFLPLLTLIPLIAGSLGAAGGLTGGIQLPFLQLNQMLNKQGTIEKLNNKIELLLSR